MIRSVKIFLFALAVVWLYSPAIVHAFNQGSLSAKEKPGYHQLILFFQNWHPETRTLFDGLTPEETKFTPHYRASFNRRGLIKTVTFVDKKRKDQWTYHLLWDKEGKRSSYSIEFHVRKPLTDLHKYYFAYDMSEMRPGWKAQCSFYPDGKIKSLQAKGPNNYLYYTYRFAFHPLTDGGMTVHSRYYRTDSTSVGSHKLQYDERGLLRYAKYSDHNRKEIRTLQYDYNHELSEVTFSSYLPDKSMLERRLLPFSEDLRETLVVKSEEAGLSDVVSFLESTKQEDIEKIAELIEQKHRINVDHIDTTYSPITRVEVVDTVIVTKTDTVEIIKKKRYLDYRLAFGVSVLQGQFYNQQTILHPQIEFGVSKPYSFWIFKQINPTISASIFVYDQMINPVIFGGLYHSLSFPIGIPFTSFKTTIPFQISERAGISPDHWCASGEFALMYKLRLPMKTGIRGTIIIPRDALNKPTGFMEFYHSIALHPIFQKK